MQEPRLAALQHRPAPAALYEVHMCDHFLSYKVLEMQDAQTKIYTATCASIKFSEDPKQLRHKAHAVSFVIEATSTKAHRPCRRPGQPKLFGHPVKASNYAI